MVEERTISALLRQIARDQEEAEKGRREMFLEVGRAIVTLSDIEAFLAELFIYLSDPVSPEQSARTFYGIQNFSQRLELTGYAVVRSLSRENQERWRILSDRIAKQKFIRNVAAHAPNAFHSGKGRRETSHIFGEPS